MLHPRSKPQRSQHVAHGYPGGTLYQGGEDMPAVRGRGETRARAGCALIGPHRHSELAVPHPQTLNNRMPCVGPMRPCGANVAMQP